MQISAEKNHVLRFGVFGFLIPICVVAWLTEAVCHRRELAWDAVILKLFHHAKVSWRDWLMNFAAQSGGINLVVVFAVWGVLMLKRQRRMRDALFLTSAVVGGVIVNLMIRSVVYGHASELRDTFVPTFDFGFPSSQATDSLVIVTVIGILVWPTHLRWRVVVPGAIYVLAVGVSCVYLGAHHPSDILAGWALALAWVTLVSSVRGLSSNSTNSGRAHEVAID